MIKINCQTGREIIIDAQDLIAKDFRSMDMHRAILEGVNLSDSNFERVDLRGALFTDSILLRCNFKNALLANSFFSSSKAVSASFASSSLIGCYFDGADLKNCDFSNADIEYADFAGADLRGAIMLCKSFGAAKISQCIWDEYTKFPDGYKPLLSGFKSTKN